ncbi:MAG: hypothetical protein PHX74_04410 [Candidatus Sumerlaeales bacterium]|nr:hypothetical protein [Candidatus Sumerlaeales bacterium]
MFRVTESLCNRASLAIAPLSDGTGGGFASAKGIDGNEYAQYGIGNSIIAMPLYWLGSVACHFVSDDSACRWLDFKTISYVPFEKNEPGRGHALLKRCFVSQTGIFIFAFTVCAIWVFGFMIAKKCMRDGSGNSKRFARLGWAAALTYGLATMAWPHARTFFSEPMAALCILCAFITILGGDVLNKRRAVVSGIFFTLALFARLDSIVVLPGLMATGMLLWVSACVGGDAQLKKLTLAQVIETFRVRGFWTMTASFVAPLIMFVAIQLLMNVFHFGSPFASAYADQSEGIHFSTPLVMGLYGLLFSAGKGLFFFSPGLLIAVLAWPHFCRQWFSAAVGLVFAIIGLVLFHAHWQNWAGGWCWGPRHFFVLGVLLVPAVVAWLAQADFKRWCLFCVILLIGVFVQLYGSSQSFIDYYILYYRTPAELPQARPLYSNEDTDPKTVVLNRVMPDGTKQPISFAQLTAPIQDSIYMPQNTQWVGYYQMLRYGYIDNLWMRLLRRYCDNEREVMEDKVL